MRTRIYYFTGTGNSLAVARDIAKGLGETELVSIPPLKEGPVDLIGIDAVGIVFPVHEWNVPCIVSEFVPRLRGTVDKYFFAVATGGGMPGSSLRELEKELAARGAVLSAGFYVQMPGNHITLHSGWPEDKQRKAFEKEKKTVAKIVSAVKGKKKLRIDEPYFPFSRLFTWFFSKFVLPGMRYTDRHFWASDKCISCGTCVRVCPVENVTLEEGRPKWHGNCQQCMACIQWCPVEAVQYGGSTRRKKRYRNPSVRVEDIIDSAR